MTIPTTIRRQGEQRVRPVTTDVADRGPEGDSVAASEQLLRVVLDTLPVGVAVTNVAGDLILTNPASRRIWAGTVMPGEERYAKSKGWWHATGRPIGPHEWASVRAM